MENYVLKDKLGKGAQATVYLAEQKEGDQKCVLKKVECFDESEANKAFKEATVLQDLQHPYVSGYKEFFVQWEHEDSSVYICILMDYFPKGNLNDIIEKSREKKEVIDEEIIKKWLGQMVEALVYAHKKKILHRDIRPSNIYIQEDDTLVLGDFGVATIMGDAITCTRATKASMNYMAPEVATEGYSECSDVWSLGCVLFELLTSWMYDSNETVNMLNEIRTTPMLLDEVLEDIYKHYSDSIIGVLTAMLKPNCAQRCAAVGLLNMPYIKKCVEMSDSTQLEKRKRIQSASTQMSEIRPVPRKQGLVPVLQYLAKYVDYEICVRDALQYLLEMSKEEEGLNLDQRGRKLVAMAMKNNMTTKDIQVAGCSILNSLVISAQEDDVIFNPDVIVVIPYAMEAHKEEADVQLAAAILLTSLSANGVAGAYVGQLGGVKDLLLALRTHSDNTQVCCACLNALWGLTVQGNNVKIATEQKGIKEVCNVLTLHQDSPAVLEAGFATIFALSLDDENIEIISDMDGVGVMINAINRHAKNAKVVKNACLALASLVEVDEESAYRVLTNEGPDGSHIAGIPIVMNTYELHKDNAEVVESVVTLIMELAEYDLLEELMLSGAETKLRCIWQKYQCNQDIMGPCEKALERLRVCKMKRAEVLMNAMNKDVQQKAQQKAQQTA